MTDIDHGGRRMSMATASSGVEEIRDPERQFYGTVNKTIFLSHTYALNSSMIIEHMQHDARPDEAVVYCFFDYARRQELAADTVLAELIVQLASKDMTRSQSTVRALYEQAENGRRKPTMRELTLAFHKLSSHLKKLSVVIDALDECEHFIRRQLITALELTTKMHIHLLVFSRPHVQLDVYLGKYPTILAKIEIQAQTKDLQLFLDTRITDSEDLGWIIGNCEITAQQITTEIIDKAGQR